MSEIRINNGDISDFITEKIFNSYDDAYDWIEKEITNGNTVKMFNNPRENNPSYCLKSIKNFNDWKTDYKKHRDLLAQRINDLKESNKLIQK
jgi:hypothetical protein